MLLLLAVVLAAGCSSTSNGSSSSTTSTAAATEPTTTTTKAPGPKPTTKTPPATPVRYPSCTVNQLALDYYGRSNRHGNDFATIRIRDNGNQPCTLTGPIVVTGLNGGGGTDTPTLTYPVTSGIVLTANAVRVSVAGPPPPGEVVADVSLSAQYRVDTSAANRLCNGLGVTPSSWRLTFPGGTRTVANTALVPTPGTTGSSGLLTCRGQLNPSAPVTREPA